MREAQFVVLSLALLLAAGGVLLWHLAGRAQARRVTAQFLDRRVRTEPALHDRPATTWQAPAGEGSAESAESMAERLSANPWIDGAGTGTATVTTGTTAAAPAPTGWTLPLPAILDGVVSSRMVLLALGGIVLASVVAALLAGALGGTVMLTVLLAVGVFALWWRIQKIRRQLVRQLPGFIDSMVRLITIGNSTQAAFQLAIASTNQPLQTYLDRAASLVRAGVDLDRALHQTASQVKVEEMFLLASILGLGVRYGGRADLLLERVAAFMRDREQAEHELMAMSAETRLSAWILGLLPVVVGGGIILLNPSYFLRMWHDSSGQWLMFCAVGLQAVGVVMLYRLARLT